MKRAAGFALFFGLVLGHGCATVPDATALPTYEEFPFFIPFEFAYYADLRFPGYTYFRGYLVLERTERLLIMATRSVNAHTGVEARKEVQFSLTSHGRLAVRILNSTFSDCLNDPALNYDIEDATSFLHALLEASYDESALTSASVSNERFGAADSQFTHVFPVFNFSELFYENQSEPAYYLITGGFIKENDFDVFFKNEPIVRETETSGGRIPVGLETIVETPSVEWRLDTNWKRQDLGDRVQYWLQVNGVRDAYVTSIRFDGLFGRMRKVFSGATPMQKTAKFLRVYLHHYTNIFYPQFQLEIGQRGGARLEFANYDDQFQVTIHHLEVFVDGDDCLIAIVGGFRNMLLDNEAYFDRIKNSMKPLATR